MCSLPPCCEEEKNVSGDVCPFLPVLLVIFFLFFFSSLVLSFINSIPHCTICHFPFIPPPNFLSIYCPCVTLSGPLTVPSLLPPCHLHFLLTAPSCRLPLKSWLLWLRLAVCDKGLQAKLALMNTQPHHLNGLPPWTPSWQLIGCSLSQWEPASHWARWIWQQRMLGVSQVLVLRKNFVEG